jgi:hypothetical protein
MWIRPLTSFKFFKSEAQHKNKVYLRNEVDVPIWNNLQYIFLLKISEVQMMNWYLRNHYSGCLYGGELGKGVACLLCIFYTLKFSCTYAQSPNKADLKSRT